MTHEAASGMTSGLIFNIQKYSIQDGPGIRTTVFLKGCPLRCVWCHNPESICPRPQVVFLQNRCIQCGECGRYCPEATREPPVLALPPGAPRCRSCGACVEACPTQARQMAGRRMTVDEVMQQVLEDQAFYIASGGGVTFSGGEPLAQPAFLRELLDACRAHGLHTAVDTCGLVSRKDLERIVPITDLFLYDLKVVDDAKHVRYTQVSNTPILKNLRWLAQAHGHIWVRVPIVPGFNDSAADLEATARFIRGVTAVDQVNLLPFHRTGLDKLKRLGQATTMADTAPPSAQAMEQAVAVFQSFGITAKANG